MTACADDGSGSVASASDAAVVPDIAVATTGASVTPSSVHLVADATTCADSNTGRAVSASGVEAVPDCAVPATSVPVVLSLVCSPANAIIASGTLIGVVAVPALLLLVPNVTPAGP